MAIMFKIGSTDPGDYSNRVIAGSYNVQTKPLYYEWEDGNKVKRKRMIRTAKTQGSFDMWFKTIDEYNTFASLIASSRTSEGTVACTVLSNTTNAEVVGNFFIDFSPVRNRRGDWTDIMERFTVKIEEA